MRLDRRGAAYVLPCRFILAIRVVFRVETRVIIAIQEQIESKQTTRVKRIDIAAK